MKALISPNEAVSYISGWTDTKPPQPIYTIIPNAERVAEVLDVSFEVASPLFWVDCADNIVADQFWYDPSDSQIKPLPEPEPVFPPQIIDGEQPVTQGTQTL